MPIDLNYYPGSPPCATVMLTAKAVGVDLNLKLIDLFKGGHLSPEFVELNPQHTVPTIDDNGFVLWESRAIITYLQNNYGKNDSLYPKDPKKRAVIDQRIYFDLGTLYARFSDYYDPVLFYGADSYDSAKLEKLKEALQFFDTFLTNSKYAAGDNLTLADLTLVVSISSFDAVGFDLSPYKNITKWYTTVKATAPGYEEINGKNSQMFKEIVKDKLSK